MSKLTQSLTIWLFGLDRWKKRLLQISFDVSITPLALLLAFFMRLETTAYIYQLDTYIGVLIAMIATLSVFAAQGLYNNFARYISIETANNYTIGGLDCNVPRKIVVYSPRRKNCEGRDNRDRDANICI